MKPFTSYLQESHRIYEFKIKIADGKCTAKDIQAALSQFQCAKCSSGKSLPIAENHSDFPDHKNISVTLFDIVTSYPATSTQIRAAISESCNLPLHCVVVRNLKEEDEIRINNANSEKSGKALLNTFEIESESAQDKVGDKWVMSFLKELGKTKNIGEQYKGVNDNILASSMPTHDSETPKAESAKINTDGPLSKQVKIPSPIKGAK
jgi:hypothetical protein